MKQRREWTIVIPSWMVVVPANKQRAYSIALGRAKAFLRKDEEIEDGTEEESEEESR